MGIVTYLPTYLPYLFLQGVERLSELKRTLIQTNVKIREVIQSTERDSMVDIGLLRSKEVLWVMGYGDTEM